MRHPSKIIHIDMDAFFASVEQRDNPDFKGKPLVIGGPPNSRGVVCTASYEARIFGVRSAMSCAQAKKLCPQAIFIMPHFSKYKDVSKQLHKIFHEVTEVIEPLSLDEAYLDVTKNKFDEPSATLLAQYLKSRIKAQLGLTASAGVSSVKFMAKMASDMQKPDGLTVIPPDKILETISPLPIRKLWSVGAKTEEKLHALHIYTVEDLRNSNPQILHSHLGSQGTFLYELSHGRDDRKIKVASPSKSIGKESTFAHDILSMSDKELQLRHFTSYLCEELVKKQIKIQTITVKAKFSDFSAKSREKTLSFYTNQEEEIYPIACELLHSIPDIQTRSVRLLGISGKNIEGETKHSTNTDQLELFSY